MSFPNSHEYGATQIGVRYSTVMPAKVGIQAWDKPMRALADTSGVEVERMTGVYCGSRSYRFDNIQVWPVGDFVKAIFAGEVF
jgi:hypothetical protein